MSLLPVPQDRVANRRERPLNRAIIIQFVRRMKLRAMRQTNRYNVFKKLNPL